MSRIAVVAVLACVPSFVRADGFVEGVIGVVEPLEDDDYDAAVDTSVKLGLAYGTHGSPVGLDFRLDVTPLSDDADSAFVQVSFFRVRGLAGVRGATPIGPRVQMYGRAAAGIDVLRASVEGQLLGTQFEFSDTDPGLALEFGGGIVGRVGSNLRVGIQLAVPFAFHFDDDDPNDLEDIDLEYTAVDLDILFTIGAALE